MKKQTKYIISTLILGMFIFFTYVSIFDIDSIDLNSGIIRKTSYIFFIKYKQDIKESAFSRLVYKYGLAPKDKNHWVFFNLVYEKFGHRLYASSRYGGIGICFLLGDLLEKSKLHNTESEKILIKEFLELLKVPSIENQKLLNNRFIQINEDISKGGL